jgi:hypothetical protein
MKHLSRGLAAGAAGLLLSVGLAAAPAGAAVANCQISVNDPPALAEGDAGSSTPNVFTVSAVSNDGSNPCNGVVVNYTFGGTATSGTDYVGTNGSLNPFGTGANGSTQTATIPYTILGDDVEEGNETITVTLTTSSGATLAKANGATSITNDDTDFIGAGGAITINPTSGPAGTVINVSGTACEADTVDVALGASSGQSGDTVANRDDVAVADDGTFTTTLTVPAGSDPALTYTVVATCGDDNYPGQAFDVTPTSTTPTTPGGDGPTGANGYRMVAADGGIFTFGDRDFWGSTGDRVLNKPIVGGATDISDYEGYWIVASDGGVFAFNAEFYGSLGGQTLTSPAVEIEPIPSGKGYYIVLADGRVYTFGDANHFGDMAGKTLNKPIIGMSVTPTGRGYWLVAADGGIFNFGDADFFGSMGDKRLNAPVIDLAPAVDNKGYYLLGADGGVFTFGSADFKGSTGDMKLNQPVLAMLVAPNGAGYWLAAADGGIFTFGAVDFLGSMGGTKLNSPVLDLIN